MLLVEVAHRQYRRRAAMSPSRLRLLSLLLLGFGRRPVATEDDRVSLYKCKDASSDWPLPCKAPSNDIANYKFGDQFPVSAWW